MKNWDNVSGGLVFVGDEYRHFIALDGRTGRKVWQLGLSGPVMGNPVSYAVDGRQYIAVMVGAIAATSATPATSCLKSSHGTAAWS